MAATKVTFVTGTAEVRRRDPEHHLTTGPHSPQQVTYVDGKCTCCPYGYHIDLDFVNFCRDMESGATLRNLKRIQKAKRKLRKSMEVMLDEQEGITSDPNSLPLDVVHSTEAGRLMHMVNYERSATHRILNQIDSSVNTTLGRLDGGRGQRYLSSDSDDLNIPMTPNRPGYQRHDESGATPISFTSGRTDSLTSLSSVSSVSSESPLYQAHLYQSQSQQQQQQHSTSSMQRIHRTTTKVIENPVIEMGTAEMKPMDEVDYAMESPVMMTPPLQSPPPRASPDINHMSLHSVREAMAVSLQRLKELEEQVKALPILQVRISVLKEEKRLLNLQLKASKASSKPLTTSVGVGNHSVIEPYLLQPDLPTGYTVRENVTTTEFFSTSVEQMSKMTALSTPSLNLSFRHRSVGSAGEDYYRHRPASATPLSAENTNTSPHFTINQIQRTTPKSLTRSVGVGEGNVFDASSGLQIHEKEMRTVIIGQGNGVAKRNVGIECRVPTRDVGVSFMCDQEKPQTRTIGVNVNYDTSGILTSFDFKGETELRMALKGVLQRNVSTKATNCNFKTPTVEKSTGTADTAGISVGCGDETHRIDVEVRQPMTKKTIGLMAKPESAVKCVSTDKGWKLDAGTNTVMIDKYNKAIMTDRVRQMFAATNTEATMTRQSSNQTDQKMFVSLNQLKHTGCNTQKATTYNMGTSPDILLTRSMGVNTTENVKNLFEESVRQPEINPYTIISPRKEYTAEEKIIEKGSSQAQAFMQESSTLTESKTTSHQEPVQTGNDSSSFSSYEITRRSSAPVSNLMSSSYNESLQSSISKDQVDRSSAPVSNLMSSSYNESLQSSVTKDQVDRTRTSPKKEDEEDSFSETITEHYIITKDGKRLISQEKDKTVLSGGKTSSSKSTVYGPGASESYSSSGISSSLGQSSLESQDSSVHLSSYQSSLSERGGEASDSSTWSPGGYKSRIALRNKRSHSPSSSSSSYSSRSSRSTSPYRPMTSSSSYNRASTGSSIGSAYGSGSDIRSNDLSSSSDMRSNDLSSSSSSSTTSTTVVTNPYRTVQNLAAASSMIQESTDSTDFTDSGNSGSGSGGGFRQMSKTSSEGNLFREQATGSSSSSSSSSLSKPHLAHVKSMDTIYDIRRVGSVEDFMPDDIRKYMSIDPSNSKDSGFGEDLHQRFSEGGVSSSSSTARSSSSSPGKKGGNKSVRTTTRTVTTRTTSKKGDEVSMQETKTIEGPDGKTTTTYIENSGGDKDSLTSSGLSSGGGGGSDSNLSSSTMSNLSSSTSPGDDRMTVSAHEATSRSPGKSEKTRKRYGSLDRKTGKLKSIMKHGAAVEKESKKGITFAESVIGGTGSSNDDEDNSSESGESDASFEEGSYDSQQGEVSFQCQDDQAIAQGVPGAQMFDQNIRETYELSPELKEACSVLATYLVDSTTIQTKQLNASTNLVQQEWFRVSSHKLSSCHQVEDYLSSVNEISRRLLQHIINMVDSNGNTAIHYCISHSNFDIASLLMDSEVCDINKQNKAGYTPLMLAGLAQAQNFHQREIIRRIFLQGDINEKATSTDQTALMLAASHGRTEMVKLLVETGADYNMADVDGSTALMCACEHGHLDIVSFLLGQPNINAEATDNEGSTALTIAMEAGHKDVGVVLYKHINFSKTSFSSSSSSSSSSTTVTHKKRKSSSGESSRRSRHSFR